MSRRSARAVVESAVRAGVERLEARMLLEHVTGLTRARLLAHPEWQLSASEVTRLEELVRRRLAAEPMAYLVGEREFYGRLFKCDARALIPRPETELLVDIGVAAARDRRAPRVVEIGTGSGAVALSVAIEAGVPVLATDVSLAALRLARENAVRLGAQHVTFVQTDLLAGLRGPIDVLLANLPYVPSARALPPDVKDFEPHVALFGGQRGTELIERLLAQAVDVLAPGGVLAVELDEEEQAAPVSTLARQLYPSAHVSVEQDHGGYDRVVRVSRPRAG